MALQHSAILLSPSECHPSGYQIKIEPFSTCLVWLLSFTNTCLKGHLYYSCVAQFPSLKRFTSIFHVYVLAYMNVCTLKVPGVHGGQNWASAPRELEL